MKRTKRLAVAGAVLLAASPGAWSAEQSTKDKAAEEQVIKPQVERKQVTIPKIDADDIEIGVYYGTLSVEDFGANSVTGARIGYHVTEDIFVEASYAKSQISDEQYRNFLPSGIFPNTTEDLTYYNLSVGWNLLPGEVFAGKSYAFSSGVYIIAGLGQVEFVDVTATDFSFGLGIRVMPTDWFALRFEMRDHVWDQDLLGDNKTTNNFEMTLGLSVYF